MGGPQDDKATPPDQSRPSAKERATPCSTQSVMSASWPFSQRVCLEVQAPLMAMGLI